MIAPRRSRRWTAPLLRLGGSAVLLAVLFALLPVDQIWRGVRAVPAATWLVALAGFFLFHLAGAAKWYVLLRLAATGLSFARTVQCYFAGVFGTVLLPSIIGGDVLSVGLAFRHGTNRPGIVLATVAGRLLDLCALALLAIAGLALLPAGLGDMGLRVPWLPIALAGGTALIALPAGWIVAGAVLKRSIRLRQGAARLRRALRSVARRPRRLALAFAFALATQSGLVALTVLLGEGVGLDLPIGAWLFAWTVAKLAAFLPITQGGIGTREVVFAVLLAPLGAPGSLAVAAGLAWEAVLVPGCLIAGVLSLILGRYGTSRGGAGRGTGAAKAASP